jgi:hypothetical protein
LGTIIFVKGELRFSLVQGKFSVVKGKHSSVSTENVLPDKGGHCPGFWWDFLPLVTNPTGRDRILVGTRTRVSAPLARSARAPTHRDPRTLRHLGERPFLVPVSNM